jgi:IS30 family transposase
VLKKELLEHLRARRTVRRSRHASMKRNGLGQIKNAVSISERPPSVEDRAVPGHWEGDLIGGSANSYVATLGGVDTYRIHKMMAAIVTTAR